MWHLICQPGFPSKWFAYREIPQLAQYLCELAPSEIGHCCSSMNTSLPFSASNPEFSDVSALSVQLV